MRYTVLTALPLALAAPLVARDETVSSKYIVVLKSDAPSLKSTGHLSSMAAGTVANIPKDRVYEIGSFKGFAAALDTSQIEALKQDATVCIITHFQAPCSDCFSRLHTFQSMVKHTQQRRLQNRQMTSSGSLLKPMCQHGALVESRIVRLVSMTIHITLQLVREPAAIS